MAKTGKWKHPVGFWYSCANETLYHANCNTVMHLDLTPAELKPAVKARASVLVWPPGRGGCPQCLACGTKSTPPAAAMTGELYWGPAYVTGT